MLKISSSASSSLIIASLMLIFGSNIFLVECQSNSKTCTFKEIDMCLTNFYYDQKGVPMNGKQLKKSCQVIKTLNKCLFTYADRCMSTTLRQSFKFLYEPIIQPTLDLCAKPIGHPDHLELFRYGPCLNVNSKKIGKCSENIPNTIFYTLEQSYKNRIPTLCCQLRQLINCISNKTMELCGDDARKFSLRSNPFNEIILGLCQYYDPDSIRCNGRMIPDGWKSTEDPKSPLARMINAFF